MLGLACPLVVPPQATCCHSATQNCDKRLNSELLCLPVILIRNTLSNALSYLVVVVLIVLEVLIILAVVLLDTVSVAVPFGASFLVHVSGTYLPTDSGECQARKLLRINS